MAQRRPKAAILGSRIGPFQTRSLVDEPARRLPPDKCPDLPLQGSPETRAPFWCHPPAELMSEPPQIAPYESRRAPLRDVSASQTLLERVLQNQHRCCTARQARVQSSSSAAQRTQHANGQQSIHQKMRRLMRQAAHRGRGFRVHRAEPGFLATTEAFGPLAETTKPLTYYSAWFCPFAHRATLALEHHADVVPYAWEEALGWEQRPPTGDEDLDADDREDFWYHYKSPGLLEANPLGMVPTLVDEDGRVVTESAVCVQFVDELAKVRGCVYRAGIASMAWRTTRRFSTNAP